MVREKEQNQFIYNERVKKINCYKEFMVKEQADYDLAKHAVSIIEGTRNTPLMATPKRHKKVDLDVELANRRKPMQRGAVTLRHFYFVE